jgi:hypothetical protein
VKRYIRHPAEMAESEINAFLTHLTVKEKSVPQCRTKRLPLVMNRNESSSETVKGRKSESPGCPNRSRCRWQWVFPKDSRWKNPKTGE